MPFDDQVSREPMSRDQNDSEKRSIIPVILHPSSGDLIEVDRAFGALATLSTDRLSLLSRLTDAWLHSKRSHHTQTNYRRDLAGWLRWCTDGGRHPLEVRIADVDEWIADQRQGDDERKPAAEASIARRVSTISSWYSYLINNTAADPEPLIKHNPAKTDARPQINPDYSPTVGLAQSEADQLMEAADADGVTSGALIRLLLLDGLRCGSVIAARIEHLGHDRGHRILTITVKGGDEKKVAIPPVLGAAIDAMLAERGNPTEGPLFVTPRGKPVYESYVFRLIRRLARRAGLPAAGNLSPHSLRHTAITELLDSGASLRDVQDFAGHADPRTTRRYDRRRNNLDRHGSYVLAGRFGQKAGNE